MRGGCRSNSGRKKVSKYDKRMSFSLSLKSSTIDDIRFLQQEGYNINQLFERWLSSLYMTHFINSDGFTKKVAPCI